MQRSPTRTDHARGPADKKDFIEGYKANMAIPWTAAERGFIDAVIDPHQTLLLIRKSLKLLRDKRSWFRTARKHGPISV